METGKIVKVSAVGIGTSAVALVAMNLIRKNKVLNLKHNALGWVVIIGAGAVAGYITYKKVTNTGFASANGFANAAGFELEKKIKSKPIAASYPRFNFHDGAWWYQTSSTTEQKMPKL